MPHRAGRLDRAEADASFKRRIGQLAVLHNGGTVWEQPKGESTGNTCFIVPPAVVQPKDAPAYRALFASATSSHDLFDVVQAIRLHQRGATPDASLDAVRQHADEHGEVDFAAVANPRDEL